MIPHFIDGQTEDQRGLNGPLRHGNNVSGEKLRYDLLKPLVGTRVSETWTQIQLSADSWTRGLVATQTGSLSCSALCDNEIVVGSDY